MQLFFFFGYPAHFVRHLGLGDCYLGLVFGDLGLVRWLGIVQVLPFLGLPGAGKYGLEILQETRFVAFVSGVFFLFVVIAFGAFHDGVGWDLRSDRFKV